LRPRCRRAASATTSPSFACSARPYDAESHPSMALVMMIPGWGVHHSQHLRPTRFQEAPHQCRCRYKEGDVEPGRIIPAKGSLDHSRVALLWNETKSSENHFYDQRCGRHRHVEGDEEEACHLQSIILAIDVEDGKDNQVGEDECDHAAETDAAVPKHRGKRYVSDRANERNDRNQRADDRSPNLRNGRVIDQEERLPELVRNPGRQGTRDEKTADDVHPDRDPIHHEIMADRG